MKRGYSVVFIVLISMLAGAVIRLSGAQIPGKSILDSAGAGIIRLTGNSPNGAAYGAGTAASERYPAFDAENAGLCGAGTDSGPAAASDCNIDASRGEVGPFSAGSSPTGVQLGKADEGIAHTAGYSVAGESAAAGGPDEKFLTPDDIAGFERMALADKLAAASIICKINKDDLDRVFDIARDGVTYEEMRKIRSMLEAHLSLKEIGALEVLLRKAKG